MHNYYSNQKLRVFCLFIITFIGSTQCNASNRIINQTQYNLEKTSLKALKALHISDVELYLSPFHSTMKKKSGQIDFHGFFQPISKNQYIIYLDEKLPYRNVVKILFHEIAHLEQLYSGRLKVLKNSIVFNNKAFNAKTMYFHRLYEKEAREQSKSLILNIGYESWQHTPKESINHSKFNLEDNFKEALNYLAKANSTIHNQYYKIEICIPKLRNRISYKRTVDDLYKYVVNSMKQYSQKEKKQIQKEMTLKIGYRNYRKKLSHFSSLPSKPNSNKV